MNVSQSQMHPGKVMRHPCWDPTPASPPPMGLGLLTPTDACMPPWVLAQLQSQIRYKPGQGPLSRNCPLMPWPLASTGSSKALEQTGLDLDQLV